MCNVITSWYASCEAAEGTQNNDYSLNKASAIFRNVSKTTKYNYVKHDEKISMPEKNMQNKI